MFDELTHFLQDEYEYLKTRVRGTGGYPLKVMSATNPGNIGHGWVKAYFIDAAEPEALFTDRQGRTRIFIPAKVSDHPSKQFVESYTANLQAISDPDSAPRPIRRRLGHLRRPSLRRVEARNRRRQALPRYPALRHPRPLGQMVRLRLGL
jgi:hypothetical protein